jgi:hypothetical protein
MKRYGLSKSKITAFEQCPKRLWLQVHRPEEAASDGASEARFATGHEVGEMACSLRPNGIMIEAEPDLRAALKKTADVLSSGWRRPIFEGTFERDGVLVRVDVLEPARGKAWHVAEVKSCTGVKDYHLGDIATQVWVLEGSGIKVSSVALRHINNRFVLEEDGCYDGLLTDARVDQVVKPLVAKRAEVIAAAREVLNADEPKKEVGDHCDDPFPCPFHSRCRRDLPEPKWPISLLPNTGKRLAKKWAEQGIVELTDLPEGSLKSDLHVRILNAITAAKPYHDSKAAKKAIKAWRWPRTWLDLETIAFAVPRWVGTKPYEQTPFQFSAHVEKRDGSLEHREFLSIDGEDPRRACAEALVRHVPKKGAVIAYNASFERSCIQRLAGCFPDLSEQLLSMCDRIVDLHPVAKHNWYHPNQRGSWSIKAVLPTVAPELSYDDLAVGDGGAAQEVYLEAISSDTTDARRAEIDRVLRIYCGRDTEAMIVLSRHLVGSADAA